MSQANIWLRSLKTLGNGALITLIIIVGVGLVIMPVFGIASLVDNYGDWWMLLFIPFFYLLSVFVELFKNDTVLRNDDSDCDCYDE